MGMAVRKSGRSQRHRPMGEINVTPFVDVMLNILEFTVACHLRLCRLWSAIG